MKKTATPRRARHMHMIKKGQVKDFGKIPLSAAQQFYSLVS
jgi:putative transposase